MSLINENTKTMIIKRRKNEEKFLLEEKNFAEINCKEDLISKGYFFACTFRNDKDNRDV